MATIELVDSSGSVIRVREGTSHNITATFKDMDGVAINKTSLSTLTLTLFERHTSTIINSRNATSVKDANGGTVDSDGTLTMRLEPADNAIVGEATEEEHIARFVWTWSDGVAGRTGSKDVAFRVVNLTTPSAP